MGSFYGFDEPWFGPPPDPDRIEAIKRDLVGWYRPQEAALSSDLDFSWYLDPVKPAVDGEEGPPQSTE